MKELTTPITWESLSLKCTVNRSELLATGRINLNIHNPLHKSIHQIIDIHSFGVQGFRQRLFRNNKRLREDRNIFVGKKGQEIVDKK